MPQEEALERQGWSGAAELVDVPLAEFVVVTLDRASAAIRATVALGLVANSWPEPYETGSRSHAGMYIYITAQPCTVASDRRRPSSSVATV